MSQSSGYSLTDYGDMIADSARMSAYENSLRSVVRPGDVVLDIGCGPALFGLLAAKLGAKCVYAIEPDKSIAVGQMIAKDSGLQDQVHFVQGFSQDFSLLSGVQADVIVSDLRGCSPLYGLNIPSVIDARERLLKPGGVLLGQQDTILCAPVSAPEAYRSVRNPWSLPLWGLDLHRAHSLVCNRHFSLVGVAEKLSGPKVWATLDYLTVKSPHFSGSLEWTVEQDLPMHGWASWFDAQVYSDIGFSNHLGRSGSIYGQMFFPLPMPLSLRVGDHLQLMLRANLIGQNYVWTWDTVVRCESGVVHQFKQSSFKGHLVEPREWTKRQTGYRGCLTARGKAAAFVLAQIDSNRTIGEISQQLVEQFPSFINELDRARTFVADLSVQFSQSVRSEL